MPFGAMEGLRRLVRRQLAARSRPDAGEGPPPVDHLRVEAEGECLPSRIYRRLDDNEKWLRMALGDPADLVVRRCEVRKGRGETQEALVCYLQAMADPGAVSDVIIRAVTYEAGVLGTPDRAFPGRPVLVHAGELRRVGEWREVLYGLLSGDTVLFLEGEERALLCGTRGFETRKLEEPTLESTMKGPREGFVESISVNATLLRRWVKTPRLRLRRLILGDLANLAVEVAYIEGVAGRELVSELLSRLERIKIEDPMGSNAVSEFISDAPASPLPLVLATERPDRAAAALVQGRAIVLVDNTPFALIVPCDLGSLLTSSEDYYVNPYFAFLNRTLRLLGLAITVLAPGAYVALTTYHAEMLPTAFFLRLQAAREGVPLPSLAEAVIMGATFELLREAGLRMPRQVGQAVSVVGALVIGDAAVRAALISPIMLVVLGITAITSFAIPGYVALLALWFPRLLFTLAAGSLGIFGLAAALMVALYYVLSLRSFGVPFAFPYIPTTLADFKDVILRVPWWAMVRRPSQLGRGEPMRMPYPQPPGPPPPPGRPAKGKRRGGGER